MKTTLPKVDAIEHNWYVINAEDAVLGRLSTKVAGLLRGKHKPTFTPFFDMGDFVIILNAEKVKVTGQKEFAKEYKRYSGYPSGQRVTSFQQMREKKPEQIIYHSVKGMLPKNKLRDRMLKRLKIYTGNVHTHQAQQPEEIKIS